MMWRKKQIDDSINHSLVKDECDGMLRALLGSDAFVEKWWQSPNLYFNMKTPFEVFVQDADGRQSVYNYLAEHCGGGW
jgi:hypothetical protein